MHFPSLRNRILMVYPEMAPSFIGLHFVLPLLGKKALLPPLGLLTVAGLTPATYTIRLVDLNVEPLTDNSLDEADLVILSAMVTQREALFRVADHARSRGKFVVMGGPYPTSCAEDCAPHADALVLNEAEITWPLFLADWEAGQPKSIYRADQKADMSRTPPPRFDLLDFSSYGSANIQFSRGCPFECEFCDITVLLGRSPRLKGAAQLLNEIVGLYAAGHRGQVWFVDDNFVGNIRDIRPLLRQLREWNRVHGDPFHFFFQASTNLADHPDLLRELRGARFFQVFLGLESPSLESLIETRKFQNTRRSLTGAVRTIQSAGVMVMGGFIIGFDNDPPDIFERQAAFLEETAVPHAYISPLVALPGTPLFERMKREGRLLAGEETKHSVLTAYTNIHYLRPLGEFLDGHQRLLERAYLPEAFFSRAAESLRRMSPSRDLSTRWEIFRTDLHTLMGVAAPRGQRRWRGMIHGGRMVWALFRCCSSPFRWAALKFIAKVAKQSPERLPWVFHFFWMGYHYNRFTFEILIPDLEVQRQKLLSPTKPRP